MGLAIRWNRSPVKTPEFTSPNSCNVSRLKPEQDGAVHVWSNTRDGDRHLVLHCETVWSFWSYPCQENRTGLPLGELGRLQNRYERASRSRSNCRSWMRLRSSRIHLLRGVARAGRGRRKEFPGLSILRSGVTTYAALSMVATPSRQTLQPLPCAPTLTLLSKRFCKNQRAPQVYLPLDIATAKNDN